MRRSRILTTTARSLGLARPPCSIEGCESESKGRGWCGKHYQRWKKHGSPTPEGVELDAIKNRQRGECYYCGERKPLVVDHVIPLAKGGRHAIGNLTGSCQTCNSSKGAMLLIEWRVYMKRKGVSLTL